MGVSIINKDVNVISSILSRPKASISTVFGIGGWVSGGPASQGPNFASTAVSDNTGSVGTRAWIDPSYANANDSLNATCTANSPVSQFSHYLKLTNFGFSIPTGATINGITARIDRYATANVITARDRDIKLVKGGNVVGTNKANTTSNWPTTKQIATYGGSSDLWGETWTASDINSSNFGIVLQIVLRNKGNVTGYVNYIDIKIDYTT